MNLFNPLGIPLIREKVKLKWASDSLIFQTGTDSVIMKSDSVTVKSGNQPAEKNSYSSIKSEKDEKNNRSDNQKGDNIVKQKNDNEIVSFTEPKAITLEQAKALYDKSVQFIDARDEADYLAGHIVNSVNIPFEDFDNHKQKLEKLSKEKPFVIYCAGTECDLSILLGNKLFELGYKQVYIFFGGWVDWQNADYPIEHNSE